MHLRFLYAALALAALVATSACFHVLFPPAIPKDVAAKLNFVTEHKDEFDTLFIGTSHIYCAFSPEIFDDYTRKQGLATRTFNFGLNSMHPPENFYVLEQILKAKPGKLKWVIMEVSDIQTKWDKGLQGSQRLVYWHDWPRTALTLKKTVDRSANAPWFIRFPQLCLAWRSFASNLALFARQFCNAGRVADFLMPQQHFQETDEVAVYLGPRTDGYRIAGNTLSPERAAKFTKTLAREVEGARLRFIDPITDQAYRDAAAKIREAGATTIFVVTPVMSQMLLRFRQPRPPERLLSFNDSKKYPQLYATSARVDDDHLNREGGDEFTRLLASEFVRQAHSP